MAPEPRPVLPVAAFGTLLALAVGYRVLLVPPSADSVVDVKLGAFLGLLATHRDRARRV